MWAVYILYRVTVGGHYASHEAKSNGIAYNMQYYIYMFVVLPFVYIILSRFLFHFYIFRGVRVRHIAYGLLYTADYTYTLYIIILYIALFHLSPTRLLTTTTTTTTKTTTIRWRHDKVPFWGQNPCFYTLYYNILYLPSLLW